jgi:hypothetical protein
MTPSGHSGVDRQARLEPPPALLAELTHRCPLRRPHPARAKSSDHPLPAEARNEAADTGPDFFDRQFPPGPPSSLEFAF